MKLNIGSGKDTLPGYENIDRLFGKEAYPLDVASGSCDEVRASHVLEHFPIREVPAVLAEWVRVLKPGGLLRIAVPDFEYICKGYLEGRKEPFGAYVIGGQTDENDFHRMVFDENSLRTLMEQAGLTGIRRWVSEVNDCASLPVSLNLEGFKAAQQAAPLPKVNIAAVMSMPRLAFADNMFCAHQTLIPMGISFERVTGAFWGQCLERIMTPHVNDGTDYILTLDYDTLFNKQILERLITLMHENPHVDALAPLQLKREGDSPLCNLVRDDGTPYEGRVSLAEFDKPLTRARTAHFGLTLFRASALRKMPHPWFVAVPDDKGEWGETRRDEDIQFWHKWRECGNSMYVATQVSIGHLQLVGSWPTREFGVHHQYLDNWHTGGIPAEARQ